MLKRALRYEMCKQININNIIGSKYHTHTDYKILNKNRTILECSPKVRRQYYY